MNHLSNEIKSVYNYSKHVFEMFFSKKAQALNLLFNILVGKI